MYCYSPLWLSFDNVSLFQVIVGAWWAVQYPVRIYLPWTQIICLQLRAASWNTLWNLEIISLHTIYFSVIISICTPLGAVGFTVGYTLIGAGQGTLRVFELIKGHEDNAAIGISNYGPIFGSWVDLCIVSDDYITAKSFTLGHSYDYPLGVDTHIFLTGSSFSSFWYRCISCILNYHHQYDWCKKN